ncbi:MAG: ABC transporter permease [Sphaerochaeta sp.]
MALPLLVMVFTSLGGLTRYVRATMIEALGMDYIRTARAKGLTEKVVIYSHAFRNALIPFITIMTGWFISIFSGSVVIERTFLWNGMGKVIIDALNQQDFAVSLAMVMFYLVLSLVGNLLMDLSYGLADPRVKLN